eukprot:698268-Amphidinium_carterae.1
MDPKSRSPNIDKQETNATESILHTGGQPCHTLQRTAKGCMAQAKWKACFQQKSNLIYEKAKVKITYGILRHGRK